MINVNSIIEWLDGADALRLERVLWIDDLGSRAFTIECGGARCLPVPRTVGELESAISTGAARLLEKDPFDTLARPDSAIPESLRARRDANWELIAPLVKTNGAVLITSRSGRGTLVAARAKETGKTRKVLYDLVRRYWQGGQRPAALMPRYDSSSGRGTRRAHPTDDSPKRGAPSRKARATGRPTGVNVTPEIEERFAKGIRRFYETREARTLKEAYDLTIETFFNTGYDYQDGAFVPILPPVEEAPTLRQFRYWYDRTRSIRREVSTRLGDRTFDLKHREVLGDSTQWAIGPGSIYQVDATVGDIYLVDSFDRTHIIGRPVIYLVIDVFSRMITGFSVTLEGPSWTGAILALDNAFSEKRSFCAAYGVESTSKVWPCSGLPEEIIADRGEFEGYAADGLVGLGVAVTNTPPYRADWKGIVERAFGLSNERGIHWTPGAVRRAKERGDRDYRLDAKLTLCDFRRFMISLIREHNTSHTMKWYRRDEYQIADDVAPVPIELWNWGIRCRTGRLRAVSRELVRTHLLPRREATVTEKGVRFETLYYTCEEAGREEWYVRARSRGTWKVEAAFDPRSTDAIYLHLDQSRRIVACTLVGAEKTYQGRDWYEVWDRRELDARAAAESETDMRQSRAATRAQRAKTVADAIEATDAALKAKGPMSKAARVGDIRVNRQAARDRERESDAWVPTVIKAGAQPAADHEDSDYVPALDHLDELRASQEELWKTANRQGRKGEANANS